MTDFYQDFLKKRTKIIELLKTCGIKEICLVGRDNPSKSPAALLTLASVDGTKPTAKRYMGRKISFELYLGIADERLGKELGADEFTELANNDVDARLYALCEKVREQLITKLSVDIEHLEFNTFSPGNTVYRFAGGEVVV